MEPNRINSQKRCVLCPHLGNQYTYVELANLKKEKFCVYCKHPGPNLWICLYRNCLRVGCSEQANDHSTQHYKLNNNHCLHMNLSSQRIWCYLCEQEVFLDENLSVQQEASNENNVIVRSGLVGLQNIANTCYMNSALQALSNLQPMTYYFLNCANILKYTLEQSLHRSKAGLAESYIRLIQDIWDANVSNGDYIAPRGILYGIRNVHPMFRGYQQHDTQEFLRCFMDQLHEELKEQQPDHQSKSSTKSTEKIPNAGNREEELELQMSSSTSSRSSSLSETDYETCESDIANPPPIYTNQQRFTDYSQENRSSAYQSQYVPNQVRSIITDIFDGKILSSVQCLTCDRISTREETFQDLSLPIPNKEYLDVLHQSQSVQNLNYDDTFLVKSENLFNWLWNMFRSWFWGPSVTLHDCMASFFSADELKGDNMYSCEKCNKLRTGLKFSRILNLPEVLCIHLKRFRHDLSYSSKISSHVQFPLECFDMKPYIHKDCVSKISTYNLVSVICHHGTVGGGHYTCYARNAKTKRWYEFDDQYVNEVSPEVVINSQAYVLFYQKRNPHMDWMRSEVAALTTVNPLHVSDIQFYISREWFSRFNTFAEPGPINNWAILCPHGGILHSKSNLLSEIAVPVSQALWDFLYKEVGGGPAINMLFECDICKRAAEALLRRQYYELSVFTKYNEIEDEYNSSAIFAISMPWLRKWQQFARGYTHKEPGPITNSTIVNTNELSQASLSINNVKPGSDYAQIIGPLWRFLYGIYGGGPEILLRESIKEVNSEDGEFDKDENCNHDISDTESNIEPNSTHSLIKPSPIEANDEDIPMDSSETINHVNNDDNIDEIYQQNPSRNLDDLTAGSLKKKKGRYRSEIEDTYSLNGNYIPRKDFSNEAISISCQYTNVSNKQNDSIGENIVADSLSINARKQKKGQRDIILQKYTKFDEFVNTDTDV